MTEKFTARFLSKDSLLRTTLESIGDPETPPEYKTHLAFMFNLLQSIDPIEITIFEEGGAIIDMTKINPDYPRWKITGEIIPNFDTPADVLHKMVEEAMKEDDL